MKKPKSIIEFAKELYQIWIKERPSTLAAALAYYSLFSFAPALFIAYTIAGLFMNEQYITNQLLWRIEDTLGAEAAQFIQQSVISISESTAKGSTLVSIIGFIALLLAASMLFFQLQYALNVVWKVPPPEKGATLSLVKNRLLAFAMVIGIALVLIAATMISVISSAIYSILNISGEYQILTNAALLGLGTVSFALIYKILPEAEIRWRDVWIGAFVTSLLAAVGMWALGIYLGSAKITSALEAAGVVAVLLIFFYIMAQIFLFGAIFTRVYSSMYGTKIIPRHHEDSPDQAAPAEGE